MIPRKGVLNLPYSCLSCIQPFLQQRSLCFSSKYYAPAKYSVDEKAANKDLPLVEWSSCASYICTLDSKSVIKKLDIEKSLLTKINDRKPCVYNSIMKNDIKQVNRIDQDSRSRYYLISKKYEPAIKQEQDEQKFHINETRCLSHVDSGKCKNNSNKLPTSNQLDEMMNYFSEQAPLLFKGWSYQKCSYKIVFENNIIGSRTESLNAYIFQINLMKNIVRFYMYQPEFNILRMTKNVQDGSIHIRWQIDGTPRYFVPLKWSGLVDSKRVIRYIDGFSIFYVQSDGLYHQHILTNISPLKNENKKSLLSQMLVILGWYGIGLDPRFPKETALPSFQNQGSNKFLD